MNINKRNAIALATGALALLGMSGVAQATDLTNFKTVFDTDFATAGYGGMRGGDGSGTIALSGVSGTVTEAYLYWHGPTNAANTDTTANASVSFDGNNITGQFIGISSANCWGFQNSMAYRADVSSLVTGSGNYSLANFTKSGVDMNGVSLIVFFDDGDSTNNRDVVMFDGNDSNQFFAGDTPGWNATLNGINYASGDANMQFHVGDGQSFADGDVLVNSTTIASGNIFQGDDDALVDNGPTAGTTNGGLWDIENFNITSLLSPGSNNLSLSTNTGSDCLSCILVAIDLPAGAAPPVDPPGPSVPAPGTLALLGLGLAGFSRLRRKA